MVIPDLLIVCDPAKISYEEAQRVEWDTVVELLGGRLSITVG